MPNFAAVNKEYVFCKGARTKVASLLLAAISAATSTYASNTGANSADSTDAQTARFDYNLSAITEGQWNMTTGRGAWANRLDASLGIGLWQGARFEAGILSTWQPTDYIAEVCQDFSNINAPNRPLRLVHFGLQQHFIDNKLGVFVGLRQADEDYFNTPMAGLSTGASCGCVPTVNDNFHINVFPLTALGLHITYTPTPQWLVQTTLYNGNAYDTLDRSFRFRPHADGIINLGSVSYTREGAHADDFSATYLVGWNFGNHYREATQHRHSQVGFWATVEQPLAKVGRVGLAAAATVSHQFKDPEVAVGYWNGTLAANNLTRRGGTLALVLNRAYYNDAHETDTELTFAMPLGQYFTLQPAIHHYSTSGHKQWLGQLRVTVSL